jgi:hypothetical protein
MLLLQEYEFDIIHRPGVQHAVADYLLRLESGEATTEVADDFPGHGSNCPHMEKFLYEYIFGVETSA